MLELVFSYQAEWLSGIWLSIKLTVLSLIIACLLSLLLCWIKLLNNKVINFVIDVYLYVIRSTPFLVQLFLFYYGSASISFLHNTMIGDLLSNAFFCSLLTMVINSSAYTTSLFYGGIENIDKDQIYSAQSMGLTRWSIFVNIIVPNLYFRVFPAYMNEIILLLKCSALVSTITLLDITGTAQMIIGDSYESIKTLMIAAVIYLILSAILVLPLKVLFYYTSRRIIQ